VVSHVVEIRREKGLVEFMYVNTDICPPQKRLHKGCAIVQADFPFNVSLARMQAHTVHSLHAVHGIMITAPDRP
jgi:hypothetical protein